MKTDIIIWEIFIFLGPEESTGPPVDFINRLDDLCLDKILGYLSPLQIPKMGEGNPHNPSTILNIGTNSLLILLFSPDKIECI